MADTLTEITPDLSAPSSTRPAVTPLSTGDLQAELSKAMRPKLQQQPPESKPREEPKRTEPAPQPKEVNPKDTDLPKEEQPRHEWKGNPQDELKRNMRERLIDKPKTVTPTEKKEVVSVDDAAAPLKPVDANEDPPEDERKVLPHDKLATARRINYFLRENAKLAKDLEEVRKTATAAPTASNVEEFTKLKEEHAKASDELIKYRRHYDLDSDVELKAKYDEPATHAETVIESTLKKYQLGDATLKAIKDAGGFAAFSRSRQTFNITKLVDGMETTVPTTASALARDWIANLDVADAELIRQSVGKQQLLGEEKKVAVERAVGESKQFFEERKAQAEAVQEAARADAATKTKDYQEWLKSATENTEWLKDKPVPANATEAQQKEVASYNDLNKQLRAKLAKHPTNLKEYSAVMMDAVESHHLRRENGTKDDRIKSLEAELARVKGGTRTTSKAGSLMKGPDDREPEKKPISDNPMADLKANMRARTLHKGGIDE